MPETYPTQWSPVHFKYQHVQRRATSEKTFQMECRHCRELQWTERESLVHTLWRFDFLKDHRFCKPRR